MAFKIMWIFIISYLVFNIIEVKSTEIIKSSNVTEIVPTRKSVLSPKVEVKQKNEPAKRAKKKACIPCDCGNSTNSVSDESDRIVNGNDAGKNEFPWIAVLTYYNRFYCGGSLINDLYVMSAGHCTQGYLIRRIRVRLHEYNRVADKNIIRRKVVRVLRHLNYNSRTYTNDISLLKLSGRVPLTGVLRPICLPTEGNSFGGKQGTVIGWGATRQGGTSTNILQKVTVPIITNKKCRTTEYGTRINQVMLCAGNVKDGGKDSCQGDSGGPLQVKTDKGYIIAGIVSWGWGCAQKNRPGVYTRVTKFLKWIKSNTQDACYC